jgi:Ca2+-binding RTX toxin-like protein
VLWLAFPGVAGAATASVEPFVESPDIDPFTSCTRYMMCPPDMLVFTAAAGEANQLTITEDAAGFPRIRFLVRDDGAPVLAGAGCEQIDSLTAACTAGAVGPIELGGGDDRVVARGGDVSGGDGVDVLDVSLGFMDGDAGADVLIGFQGAGGAADDLLLVTSSGRGDSGDDVLRCFPREGAFCRLDGGPGADLLTGGNSFDRLFGRAGDDVLRGLAGDDSLVGGRGKDRVDCGAGRDDRAATDRHDRVTRCERVTSRRGRRR